MYFEYAQQGPSGVNPASRLWRWLGLVFLLCVGALGFIGYQI